MKRTFLLMLAVCALNANAEQKLTVTVENPLKIERQDAPVVVKLNPTGEQVRSALVTIDGKEIPCQLDDLNGDKIFEVENRYGAESLSVLGGTIAVLDGNMIYAYNKSGTLIHSCDAGTGSQAIILTSDKTAYVLSINQIRQVDLSKSPASPDSAK